MTQKTKPFQIRAYVREGITRLPIDVQRYEIQKVADTLGLKIAWYVGVKKGKSISDERNMWAEQTRCDEIGLVHSLPVLRLTRKQIGGADPKGDFAGTLASIRALYVMEASTGLTSKDKKKWKSAVAIVTEKPPPGTNALSSKDAKEKATQGWKTRDRGVTFTWQSDARKKERKHLIRHWLASPTAKVAHATLNDFIVEMGGGVYDELRGISVKTLDRICDTPRR